MKPVNEGLLRLVDGGGGRSDVERLPESGSHARAAKTEHEGRRRTEQSDAQSVPDLVGGLGDRTGGSGPLCGNSPDGGVGHQGEGDPVAEPCDDGGGHEPADAFGDASGQEQSETCRHGDMAGEQCPALPDPVRQSGSQDAGGCQDDRTGKGQQGGGQDGQSQDGLQVDAAQVGRCGPHD